MAATAFVSTYPPHRCGIATFTSDLASSVGPHQVVALHPVSGPADYPSVVRHRIRRDSRGDYLAAAAALNASDVEVVSIQHEYGIWGGDDGAYVLDFVRALNVPVVTTLHTVLRTPTPSQRRILDRAREHVGHDRGHVQGGRLPAHAGIRRRPGARPDRAARRAAPAPGRPRHRQAQPRPRRTAW